MTHYSEVVKEMLVPNDKYVSVIDTFDAIGPMLETYDKIKSGKHITPENIQQIMFFGMFSMNFYPYWQAQGAAMRPLMINALQQDDETATVAFFKEAIPTALTYLHPNTQDEFQKLKQRVVDRFKG